MKTLTVFLLCVVLTGCSIFKPVTEPTEAQRVERVAAIAELAAYTGTAVWIVDHPADRIKFKAASDALAASSGDTAALQRVLASLPVKELKGEKGAIIIGAAIILYETEIKRLTHVDQSSLAGAVSKSVKAGIDRALTQFP